MKKGFLKGIMGAIKKHGPEILIGTAIAGMAASIIFAIKATPDCNDELEEARKESEENGEELEKKEEAIIFAKHYAPTIILFLVSSAAIIGSSAIHNKRNAALAIALQAGETAAIEYKQIVKRVVGDEKAEEIERTYKEEHKEERSSPIIISGDKYWVLDEFTNTLFESNIQTIIGAANSANRRMRDEIYISMNEWYDELDLPNCGSNSAFGWNIDRGYIDPVFDAKIIDGKPVVIMNYSLEPRDDFRDY